MSGTNMSDLPKRVEINEEGPREGFQIEPGPIPTSDKVRLIEELAETGVTQIACVAFVNPKRVPGWADADEVARRIRKRPGVRYSSLWLNLRGLERALTLPLDLVGTIHLTASETFCLRNTNRTVEQTLAEQRQWLQVYREHGIELDWGYVMTSFGCNYEGEVPVARVLEMVGHLLSLADEAGESLKGVVLADTVGMGTPQTIERVVGAVREKWPDLRLGTHLHDTRGTGMANAWAALRLGVDFFESSCGGLGGCPFAGNEGAAGNICTEDLVYMCEEMGIATGIDLDRMIECARLAEAIVGHQLPGKMLRARPMRAAS